MNYEREIKFRKGNLIQTARGAYSLKEELNLKYIVQLGINAGIYIEDPLSEKPLRFHPRLERGDITKAFNEFFSGLIERCNIFEPAKT